MPGALPSNVIPLFGSFGKSLQADEILFTRSRHGSTEAAYTAKARRRLADWVGPTYEDVVDVVGEVRMANVGPGKFSLQLMIRKPWSAGTSALRRNRQYSMRCATTALCAFVFKA